MDSPFAENGAFIEDMAQVNQGTERAPRNVGDGLGDFRIVAPGVLIRGRNRRGLVGILLGDKKPAHGGDQVRIGSIPFVEHVHVPAVNAQFSQEERFEGFLGFVIEKPGIVCFASSRRRKGIERDLQLILKTLGRALIECPTTDKEGTSDEGTPRYLGSLLGQEKNPGCQTGAYEQEKQRDHKSYQPPLASFPSCRGSKNRAAYGRQDLCGCGRSPHYCV